MPGLMSAIVAFTIATNSGLSVTVSFSSAPSRFLTTKTGPSTLSIVPRMRTVSCAEAGKATQTKAKQAAASVRGIMPDMVFLLGSNLRLKFFVGAPKAVSCWMQSRRFSCNPMLREFSRNETGSKFGSRLHRSRRCLYSILDPCVPHHFVPAFLLVVRSIR